MIWHTHRPQSGSFATVPSVCAARPAKELWTITRADGVRLNGATLLVAALLASATGLAVYVGRSAGMAGALVALALLLWTQAGLKLVAMFSAARPLEGPEPDRWPEFTLLVPLLHEAASVPRLVSALEALDYPVARLDIRLLCEAHDADTRAAVAREIVRPGRSHFALVVVPEGGPRTKPNALRHGMRGATGEIVTVYDAEDAPDPGQLRAAARALLAHPDHAAVQAPLGVDNLAPGWITRQFSLEYASLFHVWLPWLARSGLQLPLGGTSNHIRRSALESCGGWDVFNVTEDADLAYRLDYGAPGCGRRIGWIAPPTAEEAVASLRAWRRQRSRWMKGFAQTWAAHTLNWRAWRAPGAWRRQLSVQVGIGLALLTSLLHAPTLALVGLGSLAGYPPPATVLWVGAAFYASGLLVTVAGARRAGLALRAGDVASVPLYWLLMCLPAWIGVLELATRPHAWNKTEHGVSPRAS